MRLHLAVFACGLRRYSTYRAATFAGLVTNSVFGLINATILLAVFAARPEVNGYDATDAVTQVFLAQALLAPVAAFGPPLGLGERVRSGEVAVDLLRPAHLAPWWLAHDLGRSAFSLLFRSLPTFAVGALVFTLRLPQGPAHWGMAAVSVALAMLVGFALRYLYALAGFWLLDTRGVNTAAALLGSFCSGLLLPLAFFPDLLGSSLRLLPWASMVQVPADVFLGKEGVLGGPLGGLALQAAWAAALLWLCAALTARATRRVVVQGG
ncbi:ABC transporter permease [Marinactinospora thermotolerans]|uniref:ABC-2 type transport system permease protein n=1 Tax=Marinactinospora thermotolerans DSM 45154 TaxID=1122192 RepID=A0A1T4KCL1_9ACTN|nr:ABC-2 family transporter protein [Marinactinospora thermotolerans]SJZ40188.1 ABC-2 type transport system permease protein [Marinactinospora thermotolerans DSM 45154]